MNKLSLIFVVLYLTLTLNAEPPAELTAFQERYARLIILSEEITELEYEDPNKQYLGRVVCRLPMEILDKSGYHYLKTESWWIFWSRQTCGYCNKSADDCSWLLRQKEEIRRRWTVTRSGKSKGR